METATWWGYFFPLIFGIFNALVSRWLLVYADGDRICRLTVFLAIMLAFVPIINYVSLVLGVVVIGMLWWNDEIKLNTDKVDNNRFLKWLFS